MTTFYDILKAVAGEISDVRNGTATGGSATTLIDTTLAEPDEHFNNGILFIDQTAPQFKKIISWDEPTHTFTFATGTAIEATNAYTACDERYPLDVLQRSVNQALRDETMLIMQTDITIVPVEDKVTYTLPAGVINVHRIESGNDDDGWKRLYNWREEYGTIRFWGVFPQVGDTFSIHYSAHHVPLILSADTLDKQIPINWLVHSACVYALKWRNTKVGANEPQNKELINFHMSKAQEAKNANPYKLMPKDPYLARW